MNEVFSKLVASSEKVADVSRLLRFKCDFTDKLIEMKHGSQANSRFDEDFKAITDVLIQQIITYDMETHFSEMKGNVFGEESDTFRSPSGEDITLKILDSQSEMKIVLKKIFGDEESLVSQLINIIYTPLSKLLERDCVKAICESDSTKENRLVTPIGNMGLWIDPIDSTASYIDGFTPDEVKDKLNKSKKDPYIYPGSLSNCTILIGLFDITSGKPICGIINQPFTNDIHCNCGRIFAGRSDAASSVEMFRSLYVQHEINTMPFGLSEFLTGCCENIPKSKVLVTQADFNSFKFLEGKWIFLSTPGAGYKALAVAVLEADLYVLSQPTTFFWDICGPHAVLESIGGGTVYFDEAVQYGKDCLAECGGSEVRATERLREKLPSLQVRYFCKKPGDTNIEPYANAKGFILYNTAEKCIEFLLDYIKSSPCQS